MCKAYSVEQIPQHTHTHTHNLKYAAVKWNIKASVISRQAGTGADPEIGRGIAREGGEKKTEKKERRREKDSKKEKDTLKWRLFHTNITATGCKIIEQMNFAAQNTQQKNIAVERSDSTAIIKRDLCLVWK